MRKILIAAFALLSAVCWGQTFSPERSGGVYYAYPVKEAPRIAVPEGYVPFYISHYGRHGSRWLPSEERYEWVMAQFSDDSSLTPQGRSVKKRLKTVCRNARGNAGQLTKLGVRQHQGIARRMASNYPEVFADGTKILARSSTVPRCRASMLAFCGALPCKNINAETDARFMSYINNESAELKALTARTKRQPLVSPARFISSLFSMSPCHGDNAEADALRLLSELHTIASDMQDIPLGISLWDIFTPEEMLAVHDANNERMTICNGDTPLNDGIAARSSIPLWQNIVSEADSLIATGGHGASLRFGHDTALYRLLTLLQLQLPGDGMEDIIPMAANLQMVFLRGERADSILVAFLLNEHPTSFSNLSPLSSLHSPLYRWPDVKAHMQERIHQLEHLRQLSALNTMVGTDQANTHTAGLFGKGSEEKGQTLPAVLVPNGQTFWTPQTQETERKCVAPFYYRDTLFQGIRASHWLVGGCTQDYGSFTVMPTASAPLNPPDWGGVAAQSPDAGASPSRGRLEGAISHPYYYAINLPREQLQLELTALSHAAIMRVTPQSDGPVDIVIIANSDEEQGTVVLDEARRQVYGCNPVHRIYQGWGESAGFSGHFVLQYADNLVAVSNGHQQLTLTFLGHRGRPIVLRMATSFTGRAGAEANLRAEASGTFEQMERQCISRWTERLHTIDIDDPDTARVNQFYGAFYRASFLPREMSDVDGRYPKFAAPLNPPSWGKLEGAIRYGDFSMWDTYRALHPLYNIIVPATSAQMMQSLVGMASEGGWLPIFPCWNSYTAAMIGDHCSAVLADAYVKGIRDFDARQAYAFMRKNAFEQPSPQEYLDGKGRRALESYLRYGYIPLEDSVKEAFHQQEQTSRTLEYAFDDFCVAQMARALSLDTQSSTLSNDYTELMRRSENWRNAINPLTGYADGRHADGRWLGNQDLEHRQPYITEGATCHYTWYVPHDVPGLISLMGGRDRFIQKLDSMFTQGRYWHGNEPCHQVAWLYSLAGRPDLTAQRVSHILLTEYNDSPGGLSGNDDAGQMSAWQLFAMMGFYPVCPATTEYALGGAQFQQVTIRQPGSPQPFIIRRSPDGHYRLNGQPLAVPVVDHASIVSGGLLEIPAVKTTE